MLWLHSFSLSLYDKLKHSHIFRMAPWSKIVIKHELCLFCYFEILTIGCGWISLLLIWTDEHGESRVWHMEALRCKKNKKINYNKKIWKRYESQFSLTHAVQLVCMHKNSAGWYTPFEESGRGSRIWGTRWLYPYQQEARTRWESRIWLQMEWTEQSCKVNWYEKINLSCMSTL